MPAVFPPALQNCDTIQTRKTKIEYDGPVILSVAAEPRLLTVSDVSAAPLETSGLGDASKALGVTATVSALGRSFPVVSQFEFVQDGRAAIGVVVTVIGAEKVTADRTALAQAMVDAL